LPHIYSRMYERENMIPAQGQLVAVQISMRLTSDAEIKPSRMPMDPRRIDHY
jgi:hypothetical protein